YGGTGLGLPISRRFCHLLGGAVTVTSEPGAGTEFRLLLPKESLALRPSRRLSVRRRTRAHCCWS
ncbi:MAG: ATP-binding protein, partial [Myxococcota bacterium]